MTNIVIAKRELYDLLKSLMDEVTGAGIKTNDGVDYIVIFVSCEDPSLKKQIPAVFKGNRVQVEVRSAAIAW